MIDHTKPGFMATRCDYCGQPIEGSGDIGRDPSVHRACEMEAREEAIASRLADRGYHQ